jgi:hypothetical protein
MLCIAEVGYIVNHDYVTFSGSGIKWHADMEIREIILRR